MQFSSETALNFLASTAANIHVDLSRIVTTKFLGAGVQWSAYPWWDLTELEWNRVCRRLEFMRLPLTRTMQSSFYYWSGDDPRGRPIYNFESSYQQKLRRLLDWCEQHGTQVILGEWGAPTDVAGKSVANDDPRWARMIGDFLTDLFQRSQYHCVRYFNLINEPHGDWSSIAGRFHEWKAAILNLQQELRSRELEERIAIVAPDADAEWLQKTLDDRQLSAATELFDVHWYVSRDDICYGLVEQGCRKLREQVARVDPAKQLLFGELGILDGKTSDDRQPNVYGFGYGVEMADAAIQLMNGGSAGFIAWYLDDAMHFFGDGEFVRREGEPLPVNAYGRRKVWGMWNSLGDRMEHAKDSQLRPWFFTWSLLTRCFPAGCAIVTVEVDDSRHLAAAAARVVVNGAAGISLAIVNRRDERRAVSIQVPGLDAELSLCRYDYFDQDADDRPDAWPVSIDDNGADIFPQPTIILQRVNLERGIKLVLPGRGVTILTSLESSESNRV